MLFFEKYALTSHSVRGQQTC